MYNKSIGWLLVLWLCIAGIVGCGIDLEFPGIWDETCYDCRTVCKGSEGEYYDACLASCYVCQGYSECFDGLEGKYEGMENVSINWQMVDCSAVD